MSENSNQPTDGSSRRTFLKATSALVGGAVLGGVSAKSRVGHIRAAAMKSKLRSSAAAAVVRGRPLRRWRRRAR